MTRLQQADGAADKRQRDDARPRTMGVIPEVSALGGLCYKVAAAYTSFQTAIRRFSGLHPLHLE